MTWITSRAGTRGCLNFARNSVVSSDACPFVTTTVAEPAVTATTSNATGQ